MNERYKLTSQAIIRLQKGHKNTSVDIRGAVFLEGESESSGQVKSVERDINDSDRLVKILVRVEWNDKDDTETYEVKGRKAREVFEEVEDELEN